MRFISLKKTASAIVLFVFCFSNSTCKKVWKYPAVSMYGIWTCDHDECGYMLLEIKKNGRGHYGPYENCGKGAQAKGEVRFTDESLYVGTAPLDFISKPEYITGNDSLEL